MKPGAAEARAAALQLFRDCLRSARRIPTEEQRGIWLAYTRGKFREGQRLTDAKRVKRALEDGREQLSRMNYFHEVRERKEAMEAARAAVGHSGQHNNHHHHHSSGHPAGVPRQDIGRRGQHQHRYLEAAGGGEWDLRAFLRRSLPGVKQEDLLRYEAGLREEGFGDGRAMLGYLKEGDLGQWKKAHARAFLAAVKAEVGDGNGGGGSS